MMMTRTRDFLALTNLFPDPYNISLPEKKRGKELYLELQCSTKKLVVTTLNRSCFLPLDQKELYNCTGFCT